MLEVITHDPSGTEREHGNPKCGGWSIARAQCITPKTKPRKLRGLAVQRTGKGGSGGTDAIRARLLIVSRAFFAEVQRSLTGLKSYPQVAWFPPALEPPQSHRHSSSL